MMRRASRVRVLGGVMLVAAAAAGAALTVAAAASGRFADGPPQESAEASSDPLGFAETLTFTRYAAGSPIRYPKVSEAEAVATMIVHHEDAITGATEYLAHAVDPDVRAFAERVIRVQAEQVEQMRGWLAERGAQDATPAWSLMFCTINDWGNDQSFLSTMIGHHEAAVSMYQSFVLNGSVTDLEMGLLLRSIGKGQIGEIAWMEQHLDDRDVSLETSEGFEGNGE